MILLSIIIPAYNVEKYITRCLHSCFNIQQEGGLQEDELEVIVVDDGSTDATPLLLEDARKLHKNLFVLHQQNQGQSVARNLAIETARGNYIYMVDSDDAMNEDCMLPIRDIREGRYDIIGVQVIYQKENGSIGPWSHQMEHWPFNQEFAQSRDFVRNHNIEGLVYGYLFRRQLFTEHPELRFTPGIYHQDEELIFKIFTLAGKTIYREGYAYIYYEHTGSSLNTKTEARRIKLIEDDFVILNHLTTWRDTYGLEDYMQYKLSYLAMDVLRKLIHDGYEASYILQSIGKMRELGLYPLPAVQDFKYRVIRLLTCHPSLVCWWAKHPTLNHKIGF